MVPAWLKSVHHDGSATYVSSLYPRLGESVRLRVRTGENAPIKAIYLRTAPDGEQALTRMKRAEQVAPAQWWEVEMKISEPRVHYRFLVQAEDGIWWLTGAGMVIYEPLDHTDFKILADYHAPDWLLSSVFYQIFPDTFADGDSSNNLHPASFEYQGARPTTYAWGGRAPDDAPFGSCFFGGDLIGITQHLDYIEGLGVNALYLNPIFAGFSNHKYDVVDYETVDVSLGGNEALIELREGLAARGMRYVLDIAPNHCGFKHPWFQAARENSEALEAEFFTFTRHPDEYLTWMGFKHLVKLNFESRELRQRLIEAPDAIFRRWLRAPYSADGWRVDVANMLGRQGKVQLNAEVARSIREAVKATNPDSYLVGEHFFDASSQLQGDQWDGVMNYNGFTLPFLGWLRGYKRHAWGLPESIDSPVPYATTALVETWNLWRSAIPWQIMLQQFSLVDSHDTNRIRSMMGGNDGLHRLAAVVQFTYPGVPSVFYGDEIGMEDVPRFRSRGCMIWDEAGWNQELLEFYRDLIALRRHSPILQTGGFQVLWADVDTLVYQREGVQGRIVVVAHRGETALKMAAIPVTHGGIADGTRLVEHFSRQEVVVQNGEMVLNEQAQGASLWEEVRIGG